MTRAAWTVVALAAWAGPLCAADSAEVLLVVRRAPRHGLVMARILVPPELRAAAGRGGALDATAAVGERTVPVQMLPPAPGEDLAQAARRRRIVLHLGGGGDHRVRLRLRRRARAVVGKRELVVRTRWAAVTHDARRMGGLPGRIRWLRTPKELDTFVWNDRVYHKKLGSFHLRYDGEARVELASAGPICTVVRTHARYTKRPAKPSSPPRRPASNPRATYEWIYFHDLPLVFVRGAMVQDRPFAWSQLHFLEFNFPDESFGEWAGGEPRRDGRFRVSRKGFSFPDWGLLRAGGRGIGMFRCGRALFYDGRGGYGTYLHAYGSRTWRGWEERTETLSAWLWISSGDDPVARMRAAVRAVPEDADVLTTQADLREQIETARKAVGALRVRARRRRTQEMLLAERLEAQGRWAAARAQLAGEAPTNWAVVAGGDLALALEAGGDGVRCQGLFDLARGIELTAADCPPLFEISLRSTGDRRLVHLRADAGWDGLDMKAGKARLRLRWSKPKDVAVDRLRVTAVARVDAASSRVSWSLKVVNPHPDWGIWRVVFPQVAVGRFGGQMRLLHPRGCGQVVGGLWRRAVRVRTRYPSGWATMQFLAAYDLAGGSGLYVAMHDPAAFVKEVLADNDLRRRRLRLAFEHPAPNMGVGGSGFVLPGRAVWQVFEGDWFDAAVLYRAWARAEAEWVPTVGPQGRSDTPRWMRDGCVWGLLHGDPKKSVKRGLRFVRYMGLPTGLHWYSWHGIPFDNDYPHYFPPREGFREAVAKLQKAGAYVMPYVNGRLWDTHDKGASDFEFTKVARPAAVKDDQGKVRVEMYASRESNGRRVRLAPMCPATKLWQDRIGEITLRLLKDYGTKAVYLDQVAAGQPRLCFDESHSHPLGGGRWWVDGYRKMLDGIRRARPKDSALTSECNAEPYMRGFDAYLTWHWQRDGQVPAFPAVYGGAVQMFGRAFRGGADRSLALRMKAGQQLVFGEQIGWIDCGVIEREDDAAFLRQMAWLRHRLRRFFFAGQMARPPRLAGEVPDVTADWQWHGPSPVTTPAVLTGAWELPSEDPAARRVALLFVNVSAKPVTAHLEFDASAYQLGDGDVRITTVTADGRGRIESARGRFRRKLIFTPARGFGWQIQPEKAD